MNKQLLTEQYVWYQKRVTRVAAVVVVVLGGLLLESPMALAAFKVCNSTDVTLNTAIAYHSSRWESAGWYPTNPGECRTVIKGSLEKHRYYYIYAEGHNIRFDGQRGFCTTSDWFRIRDTACGRKGYDRTRFRKVDTGYAVDFTVELIPSNLVILTPSTAVLVPSTQATLTSSARKGARVLPSVSSHQ